MAKFPTYQRDFKYTNEVTENEAFMLLGLPIGQPSSKQPRTIIGAIFAEEIYFWGSHGKQVCVKINCPGGNILDGFSIMDAIRQTGANTQNVGIAASMAMNILCTGKHRSAYDYAKGMIHPPHGADKNLIELMTESIKTILSKLSKFSTEKIDDMLKEGAEDSWFSAEEMKTNGLINEIIPTNQELQGEDKDPYALYAVYNSLIEKEMATEKNEGNDAVKAITDIQAKLDTQKTELASKDAKIAELEAKIKARDDEEADAKKTAAVALVDNAIKENKLSDKAELKDQFVKMALEAPEAFNAMIARPAERKSVMKAVSRETIERPEKESYAWLANNDTARLQEIMDHEPEKFEKLKAEYYESKKQA